MNLPIYVTAWCRKHKASFAVELRPERAGHRLVVHRISTAPGAGSAASTMVSPAQVDWERFCCPHCADSSVVQCGYPDCRRLMCYPRHAPPLKPFRCPGCRRLLSAWPSGSMTDIAGFTGAGTQGFGRSTTGFGV